MSTRYLLPFIPTLLILKEKHNTFYFRISDEEELFRVSLHILKARKETNWYGVEPGPEPKVEMSPEAIEALPIGHTREAVETIYHSQRRTRNLWKKAFSEWEQILDTIEHEDGRSAWRILESRSDYEYEGVALERLTDPQSYRGAF